MYAIVAAGGKQHRVSSGEVVDIERIEGEEGSVIELDQVFLVSGEGKCVVGKPVLDGAKVKATILGQVRGPKITVFKYKSKVRYRRKRGHRQEYTRLRIDEIVEGS